MNMPPDPLPPDDADAHDGPDALRELEVPAALAGRRLDVAVAELFPAYSRSRLSAWIRSGNLLLDGRTARPRDLVAGGETVTLDAVPEEQTSDGPEDIPLSVLHEDDDVLVIDKPAGLVVHPGAGNRSGTLVNGLLFRDPGLAALPRAGIVHRLDKDTSGLMVVAKNDRAHLSLAAQIRMREAHREYVLIVHGRVRADRTRIKAPIGRHPVHRKRMAVVPDGRPAETEFEVLERFQDYTYMRAVLRTGRTHQIRVHTAHLGHPVVGDKVYGQRRYRWDLQGQCLHAVKLAFEHPTTGQWVSFEAPLPEHMEMVLRDLRAEG